MSGRQPHNHSLILALCSGLLLLTACSTMQQVGMEVMIPAEITLPAHIKTLGIVSRSSSYSPDTPLLDHSKEYLEANFLDSTEIAEWVLGGFTDVLDISPRFTWRRIDTVLSEVDDTADYISQAGWDQIRQLCHDSVLDALVVLRNTDLYDQVYIQRDPEQQVSSGYNILVRNSFRIYDAIEMEIVDDHIYLDTTLSYSEEDFLETLFNLTLSREKEALEACFWSGQKYAFRITPLWETANRWFYNWPGDLSYQARQFAKADDWLSAARLWNLETGNTKVKTAARACYNMALASEMEDKLELALYWARKSDTLVPGKINTLDYIKLLQDRLKQRRKLDQQMGIE